MFWICLLLGLGFWVHFLVWYFFIILFGYLKASRSKKDKRHTLVISLYTPTLALSVLQAAQYVLEMQPVVLPRWAQCCTLASTVSLPHVTLQNPTLQSLLLFFTGKTLTAVINCTAARTTEVRFT